MPQVFQQTLWINGTGEEDEGQEIVWSGKWEEGPARKGAAPFSFGSTSGDYAD
jgi:hypothetical protein